MHIDERFVDHARQTLDRMSLDDIDRGMELVKEVGWNQTAADWALMLDVGEGWGIRLPDRRLVATSVILRHMPSTGWISMVIVDPAYRGQGLARRLLKAAIEALEGEGFTPVLDATPLGRFVYSRLGFEQFANVTRWQGHQHRSGAELKSRGLNGDHVAGRRAAAEAFGYDYGAVLVQISARGWTWSDPEVGAYAWARPGRTATYLGPLVAPTPASAVALCERALGELSGPILLDVPDQQSAIGAFLLSRGFRPERGFHRMVKGAAAARSLNDTCRITAGPELG